MKDGLTAVGQRQRGCPCESRSGTIAKNSVLVNTVNSLRLQLVRREAQTNIIFVGSCSRILVYAFTAASKSPERKKESALGLRNVARMGIGV